MFFINAFKLRGSHNELFMNILIRLCPLIRKKRRHSLRWFPVKERKKERCFSVNVITIEDILFLTSFHCQDSVLHLKREKKMTWSKASPCYSSFFSPLRSLMRTRGVVSAWIRFFSFHGDTTDRGHLPFTLCEGFMKLRHFPLLTLPLLLISSEYYPAA